MKLTASFQPQKLAVSFNPTQFGVSTLPTQITRDLVERTPYTGDYTITPSAEAQVLDTNGMRMTDNITINPIPNNYGLITWNGSTITVS